MKKSCIALILLMLSIEECLIYSDYYEAMYCDVKDVDPGIGGGVQ